ncbi:hypothetical protein [Mucilaginibacter defluvii]|uniref:Nucleoside phosphorylase domain-containing protein n=1 Tax=Mucilaginibacter defluvii TaxID=1196019 RepID=A0ABP9FUI4_9SPHI
MDTSLINLFVYDTKENFNKSKKYIGAEGVIFKQVIQIEDFADFQKKFDALEDKEYVALAVHVFATDQISGIKSFAVSGIKEYYPSLNIMYISEGNADEIKHQMVDAKLVTSEILKYHEIQSNLKEGINPAFTKHYLLSAKNLPVESQQSVTSQKITDYPQVDLAIITALYNDEFEQLKKFFDFPAADKIKTAKKTFYIGTHKTTKQKVVAAIPNATGMVDSSIVATLLIEYFRPKLLIMSGVCGGATDKKFGDIVIAKNIFTFQKGKISGIYSKDSTGKQIPLELFDRTNNSIDYEHLFDAEGNQITISIEKFAIEHDSMININTGLEDEITPHLKDIKKLVAADVESTGFFKDIPQPDISFGGMACSTMVINKEGYFEDVIKNVHRHTSAVEMESYGVARACEYANEGKTKFLIFKSVMDHTFNKADNVGNINYKQFAAFTSASFLNHLLTLSIL